MSSVHTALELAQKVESLQTLKNANAAMELEL
jgi:hypothetical protein